MKHTKYFNEFLEYEVNVNKTRLDTLKEKVKIIDNLLKEKLDGYQKRENQGSYAMGTIIKPQNRREFDADIMIYVKKKKSFEPKDYIDETYNLFKGNGNYTNIVSKNSRSIKINYSGDFHLDIVPCIEIDNENWICNSNTNEYEPTDGTAYKKWLTERNRISNGYLKKVTKLAKYMRDVKTNFSCKSILLTTLLGNQIEDTDNFSDLPNALHEIFNRLNDFLQSNDTMPKIVNPALPSENFNRHWNEDRYSNFRDKISLYIGKVNKAFAEKYNNESVKKWREVFGEGFGELDENTLNQSYVPATFTTTANKPYCDKHR